MWVALLFEPIKCWYALCSEILCTFSKLVSCKVIGPPRLVEKAD